MRRVVVPRKWRPSLGMLTLGFCLVLVTLPIAGVIAARLTHNQFVRETEGSLLAQAALYANVYAQSYRALGALDPVGHRLSEAQLAAQKERWVPLEPRLQTRYDYILSPRPDAVPDSAALGAAYGAISDELSDLAYAAQRQTLASYRAVDADGRVIAGTGEIGAGLGHVPELADALKGQTRSVMRLRNDDAPRHPLTSLSRDTAFRIFVAVPVVVDTHVIGAVYLSRTPVNLRKFIVRERQALIYVGCSILLAMLIAGLVFWRVIIRPISALEQQSRDIASGDLAALEPIRTYGLKETATLGQSLLGMARALRAQAQTLSTYTAHVTHELKSPTTSIVAAAELLEADVQSARGRKLLGNIGQDGRRIEVLLDRLRELARARAADGPHESRLRDAMAAVRLAAPGLAITLEGADMVVPLSQEQVEMILSHLAQNAAEHGAQTLVIRTDPRAGCFDVSDDGAGISAANLAQVAEPFFTTRRNEGGTGMGLAIVDAILAAVDGRLEPRAVESGATFRVHFPRDEVG